MTCPKGYNTREDTGKGWPSPLSGAAMQRGPGPGTGWAQVGGMQAAPHDAQPGSLARPQALLRACIPFPWHLQESRPPHTRHRGGTTHIHPGATEEPLRGQGATRVWEGTEPTPSPRGPAASPLPSPLLLSLPPPPPSIQPPVCSLHVSQVPGEAVAGQAGEAAGSRSPRGRSVLGPLRPFTTAYRKPGTQEVPSGEAPSN